MKYLLIDANIAAGYYLPESISNKNAARNIELIINHARNRKEEVFIYMPNFCVAETVSVFIKCSFGKWNKHVKKPIDTRVYQSLVNQFQKDIHNGSFLYHLELNRYHILGINLVAPIDHYFKISKRKTKQHNINPASTFDHLIISMGIQLAKIHGSENVFIVTSDNRLATIINKCKSKIMPETLKKIKIAIAEKLCSIKFSKDIFPNYLNVNTCTDKNLVSIFGQSVLNAKKPIGIYRWISK
jgi:hypothetical protein